MRPQLLDLAARRGRRGAKLIAECFRRRPAPERGRQTLPSIGVQHQHKSRRGESANPRPHLPRSCFADSRDGGDLDFTKEKAVMKILMSALVALSVVAALSTSASATIGKDTLKDRLKNCFPASECQPS
jgi:hypothetical protein